MAFDSRVLSGDTGRLSLLEGTRVARATNIEDFEAINERMTPMEEVVESVGGFEPRPTDVIISPFAKCGTTWLQQIFHTLRTLGDEDYDDVSRVVPWIEPAVSLGIDLKAEQKAQPRGFKSHLTWEAVPKGCRYIVSLRDPRDALVSLYHFMVGWFIEPGTVTLDEFALERFIPAAESPARQSYWHHLLGWWSVRDEPAVLLLSYEAMQREPEATVRRVAEHCDISLDQDLLALTLAHSSLDYMKTHSNKFDDLLMRELSERRGGLPPGSDSSKVREGKVGGHKAELSAQVIERLAEVWRNKVGSELGFPSYAELEAELAASHGQ